METFRRLIRGWLGKVLLILFFVPLAFTGIESLLGGKKKEGVAKTVNDVDISDKELEAQTKNYKQQYLQLVQGDESLLNQGVITQTALDSLIDRTLLIQQADKLGIKLSDAQIEQMIAQQPSLQENGQFSKQLYENYLRSIGMTSQMLIANIRQDHSLKMLTTSIVDNPLVSALNVQQIANLQSEQRDLYLSSVKLDEFKKSVQVSNQEIADYYKKHPNQFKQAASVDVDYVVLTPAMVGTDNTAVSEADLKQAYDSFVANSQKNAKVEVKHILITADNRSAAEAEKLANTVYDKIKAGMSFAQAAAEFSEDPTSKDKGGVIDAYEAGAFGAAFDTAVAAAKGTVAKPVKTDFGYHIIASNTANVAIPSFEAEKARLTAEVQKSKNANVYADTVNQLNELVINSDALDVIPQEVKTAQVQTAKQVGLINNNPVLSDPSVKVKLFSEDVKNGDRNASTNIQLANGDTAWIKVRAYNAAGVQPLAKVTAQAKQLLINEKAAEKAKASVAQLLNDFKTLPAAQALAKHHSFEHVGVFTRSQGLKREIERAAFSVATPKAGMWSLTTTTLPNELVIVAVAEVKKPAVQAMDSEQSQQLLKLYQGYRGTQLLKDYTDYLRSQAKIK